MQTVQVYLYSNVVRAQIIGEPGSIIKDRYVYSRTVKLHRNADNKIKIVCRDANQKPIDIDLSGFMLKVDIVDRDQGTVVQRFDPVDITGSKNNVAIIVLPTTFVNSLGSRHYYLTVKKVNASLMSVTDLDEEPVYIDDNYGVQLPIEVLPGYGAAPTRPPITDPDDIVDGGSLSDPITDIIDLGNI